MSKALVLVRWPAMGWTAAQSGTAELSDAEIKAIRIMDLDTEAEERAVHAEDPEAACFRGTESGLTALIAAACARMRSGAQIDAARIPVLRLTRRLALETGTDPLEADARGALLAVTARGSELAAGLCSIGVPAAVIGRLTETEGPVFLRQNGRIRIL